MPAASRPAPTPAPSPVPTTAPTAEPTQGGSYRRDPDTGALTLQDATAPAQPALQRAAADTQTEA